MLRALPASRANPSKKWVKRRAVFAGTGRLLLAIVVSLTFSGCPFVPYALAEDARSKDHPQAAKPTPAPAPAKPLLAPEKGRLDPAGKTQAEAPKKSTPPPPAPSPEPRAGQPKPAPEDKYPVIGQLEKITFGFSRPDREISERLNQLEMTVFHQTYPHLSLLDRSHKLRETLLGTLVDPDIPPPPPQVPYKPPLENDRVSAAPPPLEGSPEPEPPKEVDDPLWHSPEYKKEYSQEDLRRFALEMVNEERNHMGLAPLAWDEVAAQVSGELIYDLSRRSTLSHVDTTGHNPDERYTHAGGNDSLTECLASFQVFGQGKHNKATVAKLIKIMETRQDDRDALLSPEATQFGFSYAVSHDKEYALGCAEVVTKHAIMHPLPHEAAVGEKIEVKGVITQPYRFLKVTLAWEAKAPLAGEKVEDPEPTGEAMPYFPPLDYVVYAQKSEHDWDSKGLAVLKTVGVVAAIAGGMFIPPVALAAPLIAMVGTSSEIKPAQDIPVKGGIKLQGSFFSGNIPVDNGGKSGLYYVTVWAATGPDTKPIAISRRTIVAVNESKPKDLGEPEKTAQPPEAESEKRVKREIKEEATPQKAQP